MTSNSKFYWDCNSCHKEGSEVKSDYEYPEGWVLTEGRGLVCDECVLEDEPKEIELMEFI